MSAPVLVSSQVSSGRCWLDAEHLVVVEVGGVTFKVSVAAAEELAVRLDAAAGEARSPGLRSGRSKRSDGWVTPRGGFPVAAHRERVAGRDVWVEGQR